MSGPESEGLLPGSKFGAYEIGECIGRGAMGQVYRAEHTLLKRAVALKIMTAAARNSTTGHRRFKREARAAAAIKHPNVVEILDMGVLEGLPFIVMELLEGEDLESYLARHGKLSEQQLADLALPIIAAIGAVHDAGVVHRDIKPSNIFLAKGGREEPLVPKVLDFGISKAAKSLEDTEFVATGPGDLVGTPLYISPEALKGAQYLTARSDQYSLGVVLYQCAVGRRPHEAKDLAKLVRSILSEPIEPLRGMDPSISPELDGAVMRALRRNPDERFGHVRDLGAAIWSLASQRTRHVWAKRFAASLAYTLPPSEVSTASRRRRRDLRPLVAGLAAALGVLATGYLASVVWPPQPPTAAVSSTVAVLSPRASAPSPPEVALAPGQPAGSAPAPAALGAAGAGTSGASPAVAAVMAAGSPSVEPVRASPAAQAVPRAGSPAPVEEPEPPGARSSAPAPRAVASRAPRPASRAVSRHRAPAARPAGERDEAALLAPPSRDARRGESAAPPRGESAAPPRGESAALPRGESAAPPRGANQSPILD